MKKGMCAFLLLSCLPAWSLDWNLPIFTVRYEVAGGASEDPEDDSLDPSSLRNTMSLRMKEEAGPATLGLGLTVSGKDYYQQSGDYSYIKLEHDASFRVSDPLKLGYTLGAKKIVYPEPDSQGLSNDSLSLNAGGTAAVRLAPGMTLEGGLGGRFALTDNPADALQAWTGSLALSTRLGDWLVAARYRGQARLPLGTASAAGLGVYHVASVSLQWDPN
jgi:hypothetical protein